MSESRLHVYTVSAHALLATETDRVTTGVLCKEPIPHDVRHRLLRELAACVERALAADPENDEELPT